MSVYLTRLKDLLGPPPIHPWAGLIPQVLLWSFRRYCIEKLMDPSGGSLSEQMWDDHFELVHLYAPRGLETVTATWFTPQNLEQLHSTLEQYNQFCIAFLSDIDRSVAEEDATQQGVIIDFLDVEIRQLFAEWLVAERRDFFIFPVDEEHDDVFSDIQFMGLIQSLLRYTRQRHEEQAPMIQAAIAEPVVLAVAQPVAAPTPAPAPAPPAPTAAEAMQKRRTTYRNHGRRANRGSTRSTRARANTRKLPLKTN